MINFKTGDRVVALEGDWKIRKGMLGTVLEESDAPYVQWDDFDSGHEGNKRDGSRNCWAFAQDDLAMA